ncbi:MAG: glycosyltransferase family 4 protein [Anaerolineae bacterium]|nr:glycosyltransferase family 4 protein [Anaerolineae bacterium]
MRILMLSWEYPPNLVGGLGRHVAELSPALAQQHTTVHVVTPTAKPEDASRTIEDGVVVHRVFTPTLNIQTNIYDQAVAANQVLQDYARQIDEQFDIIHVHDWLTAFAGMALQKAWNRPLVVTIHATERGRGRGHIDNDLERAIDQTEQYVIEQANHVIVCSRYMLHEVQTYFHTPLSRLDVVFNGVNIDDLRNGHSKEELIAFRDRCARPQDRVVFAVARLVYQKGLHRLVEAAPRILAQFPETRLIIAGRGPEAKNLKQEAWHLGVADCIDFVGFISDKERNRYYQTACCAVFPSLYEPFGIVALEAMALGCPVVVSDVGGLSEIVKHTETGVTIYPDNADSVAWGVMHILANPRRALNYAARAYQTVDELYNWARIARLTRGVYRRVLDKYDLVSVCPNF